MSETMSNSIAQMIMLIAFQWQCGQHSKASKGLNHK